MSDYIFPEAVLAALITVAGAAASVDAALAGGPDRLRMTVDAEVFRQQFGQQQGSKHAISGGGEESMDFDELFPFAAEPELNPLFDPTTTAGVNPVYEGVAPPGPTITGFEFFQRSSEYLLDAQGTFEFTAMARITDSTGAVYTSTSALVFTGVALRDGRQNSQMNMRLSGDARFSNGGDIEWLLSSETNLRLSFVPTPAAVTPLLAGLVAVRRRR